MALFSMTSFTEQWRIFRLAIQFFTRIPVGDIADFKETDLNKASRYFSAVGLVLAGLLSAFYGLFIDVIPAVVTVVLLLVVSALLTGAFHEDGLADMADGIGGGFTIQRRLEIMKDSRLGTYGTLTIVLSTLLKVTLLFSLAELNLLVFALFLASGLSRAVAASLISDTPYVSEDLQAKSKPLAQQQSRTDCLVLFAIACFPLLFVPKSLVFMPLVLTLMVTLWVFRWCFRQWIISRLGGFTGDCLGGAQQIAELLIYLVVLASVNEVVF